MAVVDALVRLKADTAQFSKAMTDAAKATDNVSKSADKTSAILSKKLKVGFGLAATAAAAFAIKLGRDSVQAAQTAGAAQNRLRKLLLNTNGATEAQIQTLFAQGKALEDLTGISKENVTVVQSQLATFDLHGSTIGALTPAILDYVVAEKGATAGADEFRSMTNGLAQALNGQFGALTKQGFVLDAETKKMIKSGTESERAAAIVQVLGTTYRDFAATAGGPAAIAQRKFQNSINDTKEALGNALLPIIQSTTGGLSTLLMPALTALQEKFADGTSVKNFVGFISNLLKNLLDFGRAVVTVFEPIFTGLIVPAIKLAIGAVIGFIKVLGSIGRFISNNAAAFQVLVGAVVAVAAAMAAYIIQVKVVNAVHKAFIIVAAAKGKAIKMLTRSFKTLNLVMKLNPIGLVVAAATLLIVGFAILYKKSETFRKILISVGKAGLVAIGFLIRVVGFLVEAFANLVTGPLKIFLKVLGFINPEAKKAYEGLKGITDGIGKAFDDGAAKIEGFSKTLDNLNKKEVEVKVKTAVAKPVLDLASLGTSNKASAVDAKAQAAAEKAAKRLEEMKRALAKSVEDYNEYLRRDFSKSFLNGAEAARDSVRTALDHLESVFEAKAKMLSGEALANLRKAFDKVKKDVLKMGEDLAKVAGEIESVSKQLEDATAELKEALAQRAEAMKKFGELLRTPFGEPSQIDKAMRDSEATVDSIIGMYDTLVETINQRFTGMKQGAKSLIVDYLTDQTAALIKLVKRRSAAIEALEKAEEDLRDVLESQAKFQEQLTDGVKSFAKALITLSNADTQAVLTVTKTASGLVITQTKKATSGVDSITKQLTERLQKVVTYGKNIEKLLAAGLNREYIQQLLEAGPDAASETAALLTSASADQIAQINSLYTQINKQAVTFGTQMSEIFYGNSVSMAQAFVKGAAEETESINKQITAIVGGIKIIMGVLGDTGLTSAQLLIDGLIAGFGEVNKLLVGSAAKGVTESVTKALESLRSLGTSLATDLAQGLFDGLTAEKARLIALAESIAAAIAAAMAAAAASIGVIVATLPKPVTPEVGTPSAIAGGASAITPAIEGGLATGAGSSFNPTQNKDRNFIPPIAMPRTILSSIPRLTIPPSFMDKDKNGIPDLIQATRPAPIPTKTVFSSQLKSSPGPTQIASNQRPINVNISTQKVVPTVTATTISNAIARAQNARR